MAANKKPKFASNAPIGPSVPAPFPSVGNTDLTMKFPSSQISFDLPAWDNLIRTQGIRIKHLRAVPDPRGLHDRGDNRRDYTVSNSNGYLYLEAGTFTGVFASNDKSAQFETEGILDASSVLITPPRFYDNCPDKPILLNLMDRFEIQDIEVRVVATQLMEATAVGRERLAFPATCVEHLVGNDGFEYVEGTHFEINTQGEIQWISQTRPGVNPQTLKGNIYSIRYRYIPFFVVKQLLHEVRVAQVTDSTGARYAQRLPYQVQCTRENNYRDQVRNPNESYQDPRLDDLPDSNTITYKPQG